MIISYRSRLFLVWRVFVTSIIACFANAAEIDLPLTLDVSVEQVRQHFDDRDGHYSTLTLAPAIEWGDGWQLRFDIPWQTLQGEVVLPRATSRVAQLCEWAQLHPRRVQALLAQGRITQAQLDFCRQLDRGVITTEAEGLADGVIWLSRLLPLNDHWALLPQVAYKTDSGDVDQGLGTGTQDLLIEGALQGDFAPVFLYALAGHQQILQQNDVEVLDDFTYASIEVEYALTPAWAIGAGYHWETAQVNYFDDMQGLSAQLRWRFLADYSAQLTARRYNEESGYPTREMGIALNASF